MSSLFTVVEQELARLSLARVGATGEGLHVLVGGLGLGFTLRAALRGRARPAGAGRRRRSRPSSAGTDATCFRDGGAGRRPAL